MFELKYIDVRNFRCHEEFYFAPLPLGNGVTALSGPNGAGKSSLLYAFIWALFGKTPRGVTIAELRRGTDDVEVRVGFQHQGQHIDVVRRIRGIRDSTSATITVDGVVVVESSSRGANDWMQERLRMDSESFTTAFVIQQKEVESLMVAGNTERRRIIERLAGIEQLSSAVADARNDMRAHHKIIETSKPTTDISHIRAQLVGIDETLDQSREQWEEAHKTQKDLYAVQESLNRSVRELTNTIQTFEQLRQRRHSAQGDIASAEMLLDELPLPVEAEDLAALHARHTELTESLQTMESAYHAQLLSEERLSVLREQVDKCRHQYDRAVLHADDLDTQNTALQDQIYAHRSLTLDIQTNSAALAAATESLSEITTRRTDAQGIVDLLHQANHSAQCPTCEQTLPDGTQLQEKWQSQLRELSAEESRLRAHIQALHHEQDTLMEQDKMRENLTQRSALLASQIADHATVVEGLAAELVAARQRLSRHEQQIADTTLIQLTDIELLRAETQDISLQLLSATKSRQVAERREQLHQTILLAHKTILRIDTALADIHIDAVRIELSTTQENITRTTTELTSTAARIAVLTERIEQLNTQKTLVESSLEQAENETAAYRTAVEIAEELRHTVTSLEEFRNERIHRLAPDISEVASEILREITDNTLNEVLFDEQFTATIMTAGGTTRSYDQLSGGEAESVSLSLRLAISQVLAGPNAGLLFVDEALTAQDSTRRVRALKLLRSSGRQTIVINHAIEDQDLVDEIITIPGRLTGGVVA